MQAGADTAANAAGFRAWVANAREQQNRMQRVRTALAADLQPLGEALEGALKTGDEPAFKAALLNISKRMPDFLAGDALAAELAVLAAEAFTHEPTEK